jgi:hypothetical protein
VVANWLVGREIVEEEQRGHRKAGYGQKLIVRLSERLERDFGVGYSATNLKLFRQFFLTYPDFLSNRIGHTVRDQLAPSGTRLPAIQDDAGEIGHTACDQSWAPGLLHPNLSWSLYRHFLRVDKPQVRAFYEIEAIKNNWAARELERQINSLLYERLALSKDKKGLMRLATKGHNVQRPVDVFDVFKDPVVIEPAGIATAGRVEA